MADLVVSSRETPDEEGSLVKVTPASAGWGYVGFEVLRLEEDRSVERQTGDEEICMVVLSGICNVSTADDRWENVGGRESVFDGAPYALYLPSQTAYRVE